MDIDLGVLATIGAVRLGATARNLREPRFGDSRLSRQVRAGVAFDGAAAGTTPVMVSLDADLRRYATATGDRRVIAVGGEHWVRPRRVALRGGARFNTVGEQDRTVSAGASVAARAGLFVDGFAAVGSETSETRVGRGRAGVVLIGSWVTGSLGGLRVPPGRPSLPISLRQQRVNGGTYRRAASQREAYHG